MIHPNFSIFLKKKKKNTVYNLPVILIPTWAGASVFFFFYSISSTELRWVVVLREDEAQLVVICVLYTFWRKAEREVSHFNTVSYIKIYFSVYMLLHLWKWAKVQNWSGAVLYTWGPQVELMLNHSVGSAAQWNMKTKTVVSGTLVGRWLKTSQVSNLKYAPFRTSFVGFISPLPPIM